MTSVYVATTAWRIRPKWDPESGTANVDLFIDGLFTDPEVAKAVVVNSCDDRPARWFKTRNGWLAGHPHDDNGQPEKEYRMHFHFVESWKIDDAEAIENFS